MKKLKARQIKKKLLNNLQVLDKNQGEFLIVRYEYGAVKPIELYHLVSSLKQRLQDTEIFCIPTDTDLGMCGVEELKEIKKTIDELIVEKEKNNA